MSLRSSHTCGSQVLECTPDRLTISSVGDRLMSRQEDTFQLRLFNPQLVPERKGGLDDGKDQHPRSPISSERDLRQAASPPSTPVKRNETHASNRISDNFIMSPDEGFSPESRRSLSSKFQSPQYFPSIPRNTDRPPIFMNLPETPLVRWQKPEAGPAWKEIQNLRAEVWDLRSQIQQMRGSLREKQNIKAAADDKLFRRITYMTAQGLSLTDPSKSQLPGQRSLAQLMHDCQEARNNYGPLEDDCIKLENRVSQQEFKLARLEDRFFDQLDSSRPPARLSQMPVQDDDDDDDDDQSVSGSEAAFDDDFEASEFHPLVNQYLSKMGDLDLLHERLDEFRDERSALEAEKASRQRFSRTLSPDDQAWLDDADVEHEEIASKIKALEQETEKLKQTCLSMNLIDQDGEPTTFQQQEQSYFVRDKDINSQDRVSEYVKYPLLIPHPPPRKKYQDNFIFEPRPDIESDKHKAATRINEWILDKLRISPLDVNLLASTFESIYGRIAKDWQFHVLKAWYRDDSIQIIRSHGPSTSLASHNSSMSTRHPEALHSSESSHEQMGRAVHVF